MKLHTAVGVSMLGAVLAGAALQSVFPDVPYTGLRLAENSDGRPQVVQSEGPAKKAKIRVGTSLIGISQDRAGKTIAQLTPGGAPDPAALSPGQVLWVTPSKGEPVSLTVAQAPTSMRTKILAPFVFLGDIFLALLRMLIVPLVFCSIVTGVSGLGAGKELRRLGLRTSAYYIASSFIAVVIGQIFVNLIRPGDGAALGLPPPTGDGGMAPNASFIGVLKRMVPTNIVEALSSNGAMLQIIFFALLLGVFIAKTEEPHGTTVRKTFEALHEVMMKMAQGILSLIPIGVFCLLIKVVGNSGLALFVPMLSFVATVLVALIVHSCIILPLALRLLAGVSPLAWAKAMTPVLLTAFSTSSSSVTLPMTMDTVVKRGGVSRRVASFTLPLGATINMDGTALYECVGVVFLAQYYASTGAWDFTMADQGLVVMLALVASIGAAGIPSAGLVMMLTILSALHLPLEGAALLLAIDRPLDMLRTSVNIWSDSCAAAIIAAGEGEQPHGKAG